MNIIEIIEKKREGRELSKEEIKYFVQGYTKGDIKEYQAAALIMAIYINGMTNQETKDLTLEMANSGEVLDLSTLKETIVDKHSTGGVGDKISLILCPLVAAMGIKVTKMSGRGLGFTGGTVNKLESIPGYQTDISIEKFIENVKEVGVSIISQTLNLAPADKKIYQLRDRIACVESIPLIASSIMSKKIASGADKIVIDVTVGSGAFMQNVESARRLAGQIIEIGKLTNRETVCILTNMDEPLGYAVGNTLEVIEAIDALKGNMPKDLESVVLEMAQNMAKLSGRDLSKKQIQEILKSGKAYDKFVQMVKAQKGDISYIENPSKFEKAKYIEDICVENEGYIQEINAREVGKLVRELGGGKLKRADKIDNAVGVIMKVKVGDRVEKGNALATIHANDLKMLKKAKEKLSKIIKIGDSKKETIPTILEIIK